MPRRGRATYGAHLPAAVFPVVIGLTALAASAGPLGSPATADWVTVLQDDSRQLELVLRAPEPVRDGDAVSLPGFSPVGKAGSPQSFGQAVYVAVPGAAGADLVVLDTETQALPGIRPQPVPQKPSRTDLREALGAEPERRPMPLLHFDLPPLVSLSQVTELRGLHVVLLQFVPLRFAASGAATCVREARVRLVYRDRARPGDAVAGEREPVHQAVLNAATAAGWARTPELDELLDGKPRLPLAAELPAERLRIRIPRTGVYELQRPTLLAAGVPVESLDPRTFRIFVDPADPIPLFADSFSSWHPDWQMQEVAIWVTGQDDANFDPGDRIVFYALGPQGYAELAAPSADPLLHRTHPFDNDRYAWLVWGGGVLGARMATQSAAAPEPLVEPLVTAVAHHEHFEKDRLYRPVDNLWAWDEPDTLRAITENVELDLGSNTPVQGQLRVGVGSASFAWLHAFDVTFNGVTETSVWLQESGERPPNAHFTYDNVTLRPGTNNEFRIRGNRTPQADPRRGGGLFRPDGRTYFLYFDLTWQRPLVIPTSGVLAWSHKPTSDVQVFELTGALPDSLVLDVTDPSQPVRLLHPTPVGGGLPRLRVRHGRGTGVRSHYIAGRPVELQSTDVERRMVPDLRGVTSAPDMLIVTHSTLRSAALRLAAHRRSRLGIPNASVLVTDVGDIYDNFSGGRMDPLAIRNYVKYLYRLDPTPRLRYLLLFGEATHDPRLLTPGTTPTLVPTLQPWYSDDRLRRDGAEAAVDDWLAEMDRPVSSMDFSVLYPLPDVAVGRLAVRSASQAQSVVDKLIGYDLSEDYSAWRTRVLLTADDECTPKGCFEAFHITNTERLVNLTPVEWIVDKLYLTEFPGVLGQKPAARQALIREWNSGAAIINYQGHGSPRQIADEVLFLASDVAALTNGGRLPVFTAFSCTVSEFDATQLQSMSEDMVASTRGGAIATMGATTPTFATPNARLNEEVWRRLFADGPTSRTGFGVALQVAKAQIPTGSAFYNETYVLLGDPAQTLLSPEATVAFTSGASRLEAGRTARVHGEIREPGSTTPWTSFNGSADVEVFSSADTTGYTSPDNVNFKIAYDLVGPPIYRGRVPVSNGTLEFEFVVPLDARRGGKGRIQVYAFDPPIDAMGAYGKVVIAEADTAETSLGAPEITLRFPNNLTRVKAGTPLTGQIRDENGVNIQGISLPSRILLYFDGGDLPLDITSQFRYEAGSATLGSVTVALPEDLRAGPHSATLFAYDNLQNRGSATIEFEVVDPSVTQLANVIAFPNPFKDRTHFFFEVTDPAHVVVRVFTLSGREVWRAERDFQDAARASIRWSGDDQRRDELANGTYIYRVEAVPFRAGAPRLQYTGKVVVMRE